MSRSLSHVRRRVATLEHGVKVALLRALGGLLRGRAGGRLGTPSRILVLQLQQLGDTVAFTPTVRALRNRFPEAEIDVLASPIAAQLYAKATHVDSVYTATRWGPGHGTPLRPLLPLLRALRARRYDWTITDATQQTFKYSLIPFLVGAPVRIGFDVEGGGTLHTHRLPLPGDTPFAISNLEIARVAGAWADSVVEEVPFDESDAAAVAAKLADRAVSGERPIALIHAGSNWQSKTWSAERFAAVADALIEEGGADVVFVGGGADRGATELTRRSMRNPCASLVGETSITELAALSAVARVFVGTDSGPRNVAGAVGAPTVVVMSAQEDTSRWIGYRVGERVFRSNVRCIGCYYARCAHRLCMAALPAADVAIEALAALREPRSAAILHEVDVPEALYRSVAGAPDADCAQLRALARGPETSRAFSGPLLATQLVTDRPRVG